MKNGCAKLLQTDWKMRKSAPKKLVIFDYSGTLSIEAPCFGRRENLISALKESGLAGFGVRDVETFWQKIVSPTWEKGSTTTVGYAHLISQSVKALSPAGKGNEAEIEKAADRFVTMYLDHSLIDPSWRPLLEKLNSDRDVIVVIATDHYAEATTMIIRCLEGWGIRALKADSLPGNSEIASVFVANSADLGCWKMDRCFWEMMKEMLPEDKFRSVLIVDDFGFNEADENGYGESAKVSERRLKMEAVLRDVFQTKIEVIPFFLNKDEKGDKDAQIRKIMKRI
jgi:hypothetical protein